MGHWTAMASSLRIWFTPHVKSCEWREGMKCALRGQLVSSLWDTFAVVSIVSGDLQAALCLLAPQNHIKHNELWIFEDQWNEQLKQADQLLSGGICSDGHYQQCIDYPICFYKHNFVSFYLTLLVHSRVVAILTLEAWLFDSFRCRQDFEWFLKCIN